MKTAAQSGKKFVQNAGAASGYYVEGAQQSTVDQSARAIAAKTVWASAVAAAAGRDAFAKGLQKSGKQGWLDGVVKKGANRFGEGVATAESKYVTNSGKYDGARSTASNLPRGARGSTENYNRSAAVGKALNTLRIAG